MCLMSMVGFGANEGRVYERRVVMERPPGDDLAHIHCDIRLRGSARVLRYACIVMDEGGMIQASHVTFWSVRASVALIPAPISRVQLSPLIISLTTQFSPRKHCTHFEAGDPYH